MPGQQQERQQELQVSRFGQRREERRAECADHHVPPKGPRIHMYSWSQGQSPRSASFCTELPPQPRGLPGDPRVGRHSCRRVPRSCCPDHPTPLRKPPAPPSWARAFPTHLQAPAQACPWRTSDSGAGSQTLLTLANGLWSSPALFLRLCRKVNLHRNTQMQTLQATKMCVLSCCLLTIKTRPQSQVMCNP